MNIRDYHMRNLLQRYCQRLWLMQGQEGEEGREDGGTCGNQLFKGKETLSAKVVLKAYESACGGWTNVNETGPLMDEHQENAQGA